MKKNATCPYCDSHDSVLKEQKLTENDLKYQGFEFDCNGCGESFDNQYTLNLTQNSRLKAEKFFMS